MDEHNIPLCMQEMCASLFLAFFLSGAAQVAFWDSALARMASAEEWNRELDGTNMSRHFLRGRDFTRYLDEEFIATRAVMADLGLVK